MKKKFLGRVLTMLLVASMVFTLLPASAIAAGNWWWNADEYTEEATPAATTDNSSFMRIFHLDCGRKYFSVTEIEGIIDQLAANHYTHLQLAFGNDALRFILGDMSVGSYTSDQVKTAINTANQNYSTSKNTVNGYLSQSDMDTIIDYAKKNGIEIIPLLNSPGHMNVLTTAMKNLGVSSDSTMSLTNEGQLSFIQGLLQKYVDYFAGKCTYFNMGADEYAFDKLDSNGYVAFVQYVNTVAGMIRNAGLKPIAYNDGIYYKSDDASFAEAADSIAKDIIIAYWTKADNYASTQTLSDNGFALLNNNDTWYYVLGDALYDVWAQGQWGYEDCLNGLKNTPCTVLKDSSGKPVVGSVLCVWCDHPSYTYDSTKVYDLIAKMAEYNPDYFTAAAPPVEPEIKVENSAGKPELDIAVPGTSLTLTADKPVYWRWNSEVVELTSADPVETVSMAALYAEQTLYAQSVNVKPLKAGDAGITVAADETGTPQPYSLTVVDSKAPTKDETIDLTIGEKKQIPVNGHNYENNVDRSKLNENIATVTVTGQDSKPASTTYEVENVAIGTIATTRNTWTKVENRYCKVGENYYPAYAKYEKRYFFVKYYYYGYLETDSSNKVTEIDNTTDSSKMVTLYVKKTNPATPASTTITFTGVAKGMTYVTIGDTRYTINVNPEDLNSAPALPIQLWITNSPISVNRMTEKTDGTFYYNPNYAAPAGSNAYYINASAKADGVNSKQGVSLSSLVPGGVIGQNGGTATTSDDPTATHVLWKGTRHTSTTGTSGLQYVLQDDMSSAGQDFAYVRYFGGNWAVSADRQEWIPVTGKGSTESYSTCREQIIAYYKMRTTVTEEVTTDVVDWGGTISDEGNANFAVLDFSVKYKSGTRRPEVFPAGDKTCVLNTSGNVNTDTAGNKTYRIASEISVSNETNFEVYMITLTPTNEKIANSLTTDTAKYDYAVDTDAEKVVWVKTVDDLPSDYRSENRWYTAATAKASSLTFNADEGKNVGGAPVLPVIEIQEKYGLLITYYIRAKVVEDSLTVRYAEQSNPNNPFYTYNITVKNGTTFSDPQPYFNNGKLEGYTVNGLVATEYVYSDLKKMDGVPAAYRYASKITCESIALSEGNKVLTLYYTFDNSVSFVADFGLPLTIKAQDLSDAFKGGSHVTKKVVNDEPKHGTAVFNGIDIVYTPGNTFPSNSGDTFTVTYTGKNPQTQEVGSASFVINILPASNVLYEENFLTAANDSGWRKAGSTPTTAQQPQKVGGDGSYNVFGYDNAYVKNGEQNVTGQLGVWQASGLQYSTSTGVMTTEFYGNGFDLIGSCGKNTGRILLGIFKGNEKRPVATRIIDTKFDDANVAEMLYQVPLAHVMLKDEAQYRVEIYASGVKEQTNNARANSRSVSAAAYSYDDYADGFASILDSYGVRMSDVECISFADIADSASAAATMSLRPVALVDEGGAGSCSVEIDSFRVYRSANDTNYPENEKNVTYTNVLDAFKNGGFTAFTENDGGKWMTRGDYESNGGPQNEIYLRSSDGTADDAVAFSVGAYQTVQISARAVESNGKTAKMVVNGGIPVGISSNTEMYYVVTAGDDGIITIKNIGEAMLALGNLKVKSTQTVAELSDEQIPMAIALLSMAPAPEEPEQPAAFTPEHFDAKVSATRLGRNKIVRLTVTTSSDVAKLTVNGKELRPVNGWLVKMGWSSSYTYILSEKMPRNDSRPFEIICYNADGVASAAHVVTGQ